jgi:hypothetical protein
VQLGNGGLGFLTLVLEDVEPMGLRYAYEIVTDRTSVESLITAIAKHLESKGRNRLLAAATISSVKIMEVIQRDDLESGFAEKGFDDLCLTFLFPSDERLIAHGSLADFDDPQTGRLAIGCVWSRIRCGEKYGLFRATAATSEMSRLFDESPSVRDTFIRIAKDAGAALLLLDDELGKNLGIWPREGRLASSVNLEELSYPLVDPVEIDQYCSALLAGTGDK